MGLLFDEVAALFLPPVLAQANEEEEAGDITGDLLQDFGGDAGNDVGAAAAGTDWTLRWSDRDPFQHRFAVDEIKNLYPEMFSTDWLNIAVNNWADVWRSENHPSVSTAPAAWPTASQLLNDSDFVGYLNQAASGVLTVLPPGLLYIDDVMYFNDPRQGLVPHEDLYAVDEPIGGFSVAQGRAAARTLAQRARVPSFTSDQINQLTSQYRRPSGGGGMVLPSLDLAQLEEQYRTMHRTYLLDDAEGDVRGLMRKFQTQWRAFARRNGRLDFETWAMQQIRAQPRYHDLYSKKPDYMDEQQYLSQYSEAASRTGLRPDRVREEIVSGLQNAPSAAGFADRVSRTQGTDTGGAGFGRRLAALTNQMGIPA